MISHKAKYAFKALVFLARAGVGHSFPIEEIATGASVPRNFLEHILLDLKRQGIVASHRGPKGGYYLLKAPADLTVGNILRAIDGPIAPLPCISRTAYRRCPDCPSEEACAVRKVFAEIYSATLLLMDATTLADAVRGQVEKTLKTKEISESAPEVDVT